jgi:hypothetical protein
VLTNKRWIRVPDEDDEGGAVYRDASGDIPPSRRPKEYLEFSDDGTVRKLATGADDRAHEVDRTTWRQKDGKVVFNFGAANSRETEEHQIVEQSPDKIVIRKQ